CVFQSAGFPPALTVVFRFFFLNRSFTAPGLSLVALTARSADDPRQCRTPAGNAGTPVSCTENRAGAHPPVTPLPGCPGSHVCTVLPRGAASVAAGYPAFLRGSAAAAGGCFAALQ